MHYINLLTVDGASGSSRAESIWLIIIAILVAVIFLSYSSRLNNLDKMIKMLNEKVMNLESTISKLSSQINRPSRDQNPIKMNQNMIVSGPFNEDNTDHPDNLIDTKPKIAKMFDPRIKIHERHERKEKETEGKE